MATTVFCNWKQNNQNVKSVTRAHNYNYPNKKTDKPKPSFTWTSCVKIILCQLHKSRRKHYSLFGCHISVTNFIRGGLRGYSLGKCKCALKNPPSLKILSNYFFVILFIEFVRSIHYIHLLEDIYPTENHDERSWAAAVHWLLPIFTT